MTNLPLRTELLSNWGVELQAPIQAGTRHIYYVSGGRMEGRISGRILPGGGDWLSFRPEGIGVLDVRGVAQLDDGSLCYFSYTGRLLPSRELGAALLAGNHALAAEIDPASYYFRSNPVFETTSEKYAWLNWTVAIGVGRLTPKGVAYTIYEVK